MEKSKFFISPMAIKMICWATFWILVIMMCAHYQHFVLSAFAFMALVISMLITYVENLNADDEFINLDADPFIPLGWSVESHRKGGTFKWNPDEVHFYLSEQQKNRKFIEGKRLLKELENKPLFNANFIDHLLAHPHLIPEIWKKDKAGRVRRIFAWDTIYRDLNGDMCVRCLLWNGGNWDWDHHLLDDKRYIFDFAALRVN